MFRAFWREQTDPDHFYGELARDSVAQIGSFEPFDGHALLDVGGGPGYFAEAFTRAGATYTALDADLGELAGRGVPGPGTVLGDGRQLPFADGSFDVAYSSNVLEHVDGPWRMADEMVRVTRPGGLVFLSYTLWWGPWGGHETSPWHLLGGHRAERWYTGRRGHPPKNRFGTSLFVMTVSEGVAWARSHPGLGDVVVLPRYLPGWMSWIIRVPGLREVLVWNVAIVGRRR